MPELPSPFTPEVNALIEAAMRDWRAAGERLVAAVLKMHRTGQLHPMTETARAALEKLFREHEVELSIRFAGDARDIKTMRRLIRAGRIRKSQVGVRGVSFTTMGYRLGRRHPTRRLVIPRQDISMKDAARAAKRTIITSRDMPAIAYAQSRAATNMRRPWVMVTQQADRLLTEAEYGSVRSAVAQGVRTKLPYKALARDLKEAVKGTTLLNEMDRVARTELMYAVHAGALEKLYDDADKMGIREGDIRVYKIVSPGACVYCKKIWGPIDNPKVYLLSDVVGRTNFGVKQKDWMQTVGPTHPRCSCPPLMIWTKRIQQTVDAIVDDVIKKFGR